MVVGNHNVVVDADHGSTVTLLVEGERPRPVRRDRVALLPRRQAAPSGGTPRWSGSRPAPETGPGAGVGRGRCRQERPPAARRPRPRPGPDGVLFLDAARREPEDLAQDIFEACYEARGYARPAPSCGAS
ncbi:hypothetical protein NKH77_31965 [Streptomyces sp. M19]